MSDPIDRASVLLNVIEKSVGHAPKFNFIATRAEAELYEINETAQKEIEEAKARKAKAKADAEAKAAADLSKARSIPNTSPVIEWKDKSTGEIQLHPREWAAPTDQWEIVEPVMFDDKTIGSPTTLVDRKF